jgi:hypothetical protein
MALEEKGGCWFGLVSGGEAWSDFGCDRRCQRESAGAGEDDAWR